MRRTALVGLALIASGCAKKPDFLELPKGTEPFPSLPDAEVATPAQLGELLNLAEGDLPDWFAHCRIDRSPPTPGFERPMFTVACGPHAVMLIPFPDEPGLTDRIVFEQASLAMRDGVGGGVAAEARRPVRDGTVAVSLLHEGDALLALTSATEARGNVISIACSGREPVPTRAAFCDAFLAELISVPSPMPDISDGEQPVPWPRHPLPEALEPLRDLPMAGRADQRITAQTEHLRVKLMPYTGGDLETADRAWAALDKPALLACMEQGWVGVHAYSTQTFVTLRLGPGVSDVETREGLPTAVRCLKRQLSLIPTEGASLAGLQVRVQAARLQP